MRRNGTTARAALGHLRRHVGQKLTPPEIAAAVNLPASLVSSTLGRQFVDHRYALRHNLHRERIEGSRQYAYWIESRAPEGDERDELTRKLSRYMRKHARAARPSEIAKATGLQERDVARALDRWAREGAAVRCELVTRRGIDRFEYRLAAATAPLHTTIRERRPVADAAFA